MAGTSIVSAFLFGAIVQSPSRSTGLSQPASNDWTAGGPAGAGFGGATATGGGTGGPSTGETVAACKIRADWKPPMENLCDP